MRLPLLIVAMLTWAPFGYAQDSSNQEARVLAVHGAVTVSVPDAVVDHPATVGEALRAGARVRTDDGATVRLALPNGSTLTLLPGGRLVMFAGPPARGATDRPSTNTTLEAGTARVTPATEGAEVMPLGVGVATVSVGRSTATVTAVRGTPFARAAVHSGRMVVRTAGASRALTAGEGTRARPGVARMTVAPLAAAPSWRSVPRGVLGSARGTVPFTASFELPRASALTGWRVELARDAAFDDLIAIEQLSAQTTRWESRVTGSGTYHLRVRAIDALGLEGATSPTATFSVETPEIVYGALAEGATPARPTVLRAPAGVLCGVDGAPPTAVTEPVRIRPGRAHQVRCTSRSNPDDVADFNVDLGASGPIHHHLRARLTATNEAVLGIQLSDLEGNPLPYATVEASGGEGVVIDPVREDHRRGSYTTRIRWRGRPERLTLRFTVNGSLHFAEEVSVVASAHAR